MVVRIWWKLIKPVFEDYAMVNEEFEKLYFNRIQLVSNSGTLWTFIEFMAGTMDKSMV